MTDKEAQFYGRILELEIKTRLNTLTDSENQEMIKVKMMIGYDSSIAVTSRQLQAIEDLSFDIVSGKLSGFR